MYLLPYITSNQGIYENVNAELRTYTVHTLLAVLLSKMISSPNVIQLGGFFSCSMRFIAAPPPPSEESAPCHPPFAAAIHLLRLWGHGGRKWQGNARASRSSRQKKGRSAIFFHEKGILIRDNEGERERERPSAVPSGVHRFFCAFVLYEKRGDCARVRARISSRGRGDKVCARARP